MTGTEIAQIIVACGAFVTSLGTMLIQAKNNRKMTTVADNVSVVATNVAEGTKASIDGTKETKKGNEALRKVAEKVEEVHIATNSMKDELVHATAISATAEGFAKGQASRPGAVFKPPVKNKTKTKIKVPKPTKKIIKAGEKKINKKEAEVKTE